MPASIFAGSKVKTLKGTLSLNGGADVISSTVDPTSVAVDASPGSILLNTTSGKQYRKNDSGSSTNWTEVGAGTSGINYITNPTASTNTTGWSTYADAAGTTPVDGSGGSPTVTWTRSTTTPLRGAADFNFTKDAANRQGEGVATDITIDLADRAKVLTVTFDYEVLSGTYASGDLTVYLIADPSGTPVVIQPAGYTVQAATVGTTMRQIATFQTQATGQSYRVCFHVASTSASAYVLAIDNVICGPQTTVYGSPVTDWQSYTPTITNATGITSATGAFRRIGDSYHVRVAFSVPSQARTATTSWKISLPNNVTPDTTSAPDIGGTAVHGFYEVYGDLTGTSNQYVQLDGVRVQSSGVFLAKRGTNRDLYDADFNSVGAAKYISADFTFKVAGLSSSVQMSNDTDTRVVATRRDGGTAASFNADTLVTFANTATIDTHSGWINSSEYKISVSGVYKISALFLTTAAPLGVTGAFQVYYRVNNGTSFRLGYVTGNGNSAEYSAGGSDSVSLNAGDLITFRVTSSSTHTLSAAACKVSIERLSGPATIAASETVAARYTSSAGNAVTNAVLNYIDFATKDYDTHNMVTVSTATPKNTTVTNTGWKAIIPVSGKYKIFSNATSDAGGAWAAGEEWSVIIVKNGVELATSPNISTSTHSTYMNGLGSAVLNLGAGDRIEIGIYQNSGSSINLSSNPKIIYVEIYRIGN